LTFSTAQFSVGAQTEKQTTVFDGNDGLFLLDNLAIARTASCIRIILFRNIECGGSFYLKE